MLKQPGTMEGKTCVVTGASGGIGKETARALARMGAIVLIVGRHPNRTHAAAMEIRATEPAASIEALVGDLSSQREVRRLANEISARHPRLDVLVNNAGAVNAVRRVTEEGIEFTIATNHLAPFLLTNLLRGPLTAAAPSRVVIVSSYLHKMVKAIPWDDLQAERQYSSHAVYNLTKLMNVMFTYQLAKLWQSDGVSANCLHPGWPLRTGLGREERGRAGLFDRLTKLWASSADKGARTSVYLASSPELQGVTGRYFTKGRPVPSSRLSYDEEAAVGLWDLSARLCGIKMGAFA